MCNFFSAIVVRDGSVLWHEATDSHSDLIAHYKLPDNTECRHFAKVEFTPAKDGNDAPRFGDVDAYVLRFDEGTTPNWLDDDMRERVETRCREIVRAMIVDDDRVLVLGGCRILVGKANVRVAKGARIIAMIGESQVGEMWGSSQVGEMWDSSQAPMAPKRDQRVAKANA